MPPLFAIGKALPARLEVHRLCSPLAKALPRRGMRYVVFVRRRRKPSPGADGGMPPLRAHAVGGSAIRGQARASFGRSCAKSAHISCPPFHVQNGAYIFGGGFLPWGAENALCAPRSMSAALSAARLDCSSPS